jgi:hypothetical protein
MSERYFEKFPITNYSNTYVVDITKRATLLNKVYTNPFIFYPYEINDERADQLSHRYYDDAYQSWIIYFSNRIVDPYYEWHLNENEFNEFINSKYGSYELAYQKVKFYRNDWVGQENVSVNYYDNLLPDSKKYWEPVYGYSNKTVSYKRVEQDWAVNTNQIVSYTVSANSNFTKDEICKINLGSKIGKGQILSSSNTAIFLQHMFGTYTGTSSGYIYGTESGSNVAFTAVNSVADNISTEEEIYWKPVTYFDYENEKNEYNRTVRVIDKTYEQKISDDLKTLMNE